MTGLFFLLRVVAAAAALIVANTSVLAQETVQGVIAIEGNVHTFKACGYGTSSKALLLTPELARLIFMAKNERKYKAGGALSQYYVYAKVSLQEVRDRRAYACIGNLRVNACVEVKQKFELYQRGSPNICNFS